MFELTEYRKHFFLFRHAEIWAEILIRSRMYCHRHSKLWKSKCYSISRLFWMESWCWPGNWASFLYVEAWKSKNLVILLSPTSHQHQKSHRVWCQRYLVHSLGHHVSSHSNYVIAVSFWMNSLLGRKLLQKKSFSDCGQSNLREYRQVDNQTEDTVRIVGYFLNGFLCIFGTFHVFSLQR